jgi:hypothetical protein
MVILWLEDHLVKKYNGTDVNRLVLLDSNGIIVPGFDIGAGPSSAAVYTLENSVDGSWFVGGSFLYSNLKIREG